MYHDVDGVWEEHSRLALPSETETLLYIGQHVAIDGEWAAYGTNTLDRYGRAAGSIVGLYHLTDNEWVLHYSFVSHATFAYDVSMAAGLLVLAYPYAEKHKGAAEVYRLVGSEYVLETTLVGKRIGMEVCASVAISGDGSRILLGSNYEGHVYIYDYDSESTGDMWGLTTEIETGCSPQQTVHIGYSSLPFIAADWLDSEETGMVQVYDFEEGASDPVLMQTMVGASEDTDFGSSVAISSDADASTIAISATQSSSVFVYRRDGRGHYYLADSEFYAPEWELCASVALARGDTLLMAGAPGADNGRGVVEEYDLSTL
ncbi:hypothetical protein KIPB_010238 [Kipferlia bialata]|uniref:Uncharacterized protein n=1 Tax=Kipferlia bialata TaxID=797122 RepID=A0A9K3D669_9EUKA|nr:hypothetical protein KIPB_010238 [Kipferlia bialata]|eukprot:g10238.t1